MLRAPQIARPAAIFSFAVTWLFSGAVFSPAATLTYFGQDRSIRTNATGVGPAGNTSQSDVKQANDFLTFDKTSSSSAANAGAADSTGLAEQQSQFLPQGVFVSGRVGGYDNQSAGGFGDGYSTVNVQFTLDTASPYFFELDTTQAGNTFGKDALYLVTFSGPGGSSPFGLSGPILSAGTHPTFSGTLPAGNYALSLAFANGSSGDGVGGGTYAYRAALLVPEPSAAGCFAAGVLVLRRRRGC